jgi:hypothetical protein
MTGVAVANVVLGVRELALRTRAPPPPGGEPPQTMDTGETEAESTVTEGDGDQVYEFANEGDDSEMEREQEQANGGRATSVSMPPFRISDVVLSFVESQRKK